jgi:hypothetical protein
MKAPSTPAPIVLLDTSSGQFVGPVVDFGGQEVRVMRVAETTADFQLVDPNQGALSYSVLQAVNPANLVPPITGGVSDVGGLDGSVAAPKQLDIRQPQSLGLFQVQASINGTRIQSGSVKVTLYFV